MYTNHPQQDTVMHKNLYYTHTHARTHARTHTHTHRGFPC